MRQWATISICILAGATLLGTQGTPSAAALAIQVQAHYAKVRDFTADFTLTHTSGLLPRGVSDRGQVRIKKPLRMRWTYTTGGKQQFVSDGSELYSYFPEDKYVRVGKLPAESEASTGLLFLAGRGDITKDFSATMVADQPASEWRLTLRPMAGRRADFQTLTLEVARGSLELRGLVTVDEQGTSSFRFANLKENQGLADREFVFTIPKNADVERQ